MLMLLKLFFEVLAFVLCIATVIAWFLILAQSNFSR